MDASLVLAVDGLRNVADCAAELITANSNDDGDRVAFAVASDVEVACVGVLTGTHTHTHTHAQALRDAFTSPSKKRAGGAAQALMSALTFGAAGAAGPESEAMTAEEAAAARADALAHTRAIRNARLHPITDIIVVMDKDPLPVGFEKVAQSVTGMYPADLNASGGSKQMWFAIARFPNAPAITGLTTVMLELGEFVPPGYTPVRHFASGKPANLRHGVPNTSDALLCYTRSGGAPVIDFGLCFPRGAQVKPSLPRFIAGDPTGGAAVLGHARAGFAGTAGEIEAAHERQKSGILASLANLPLIGKAAREDVPVGYVAISRSILGCAADLTGGSARGVAIMVYAKDLSHIDLLSDRGPTHGGAADAEDEHPSLTDSAESEFRRALDALSYSSGTSPVIPLSVARSRAARRRMRRQLSGGAANKMDASVTDFEIRPSINDTADHSAVPGSASKTIADRISDTFGKLFRMGSTRAATDGGPPASTGGAARSPSMRGSAGFGGLFARQKSVGDVASPATTGRGGGSTAAVGATPDPQPSQQEHLSDGFQLGDAPAAAPARALSPPDADVNRRLSAAMAAGVLGSDSALVADDVTGVDSGMTTPDASDSDEEPKPAPAMRPVRRSLTSGRTGPTRMSRARSASVADASPIGLRDEASGPPMIRAASAGAAFAGVDEITGESVGIATPTQRSRARSLASGLPHSRSAVDLKTSSLLDADASAHAPSAPAPRAQSERRGSRAGSDGTAASPSSAYRPRVDSDLSDGARSVVHGSPDARLHTLRQPRSESVTREGTGHDSNLQEIGLGSPPAGSAAASGVSGVAPAPADPEDEAEEEAEEARARSIMLFRHMSWMLSPAATRMAVTAATITPGPDGTTAETNALHMFLAPSAASFTLSPLLRALYTRQPDLVNAALKALTFIVEAGFFMTSPLNADAAAEDGLDDVQEHTLVTTSAWALLDAVCACVCDAVGVIFEFVHEELLPFISSVLQCAGANGDASSKIGATAHRRHLPPCGLHPSTLHRLLTTALLVHTFSHQKRMYAERAFKWCISSNAMRDAETFHQRLQLARRQAAVHLQYLKAMVHGVVISIEREAALDPALSLSSIVLGAARRPASTRTPPKLVADASHVPSRSIMGSFADVGCAYAAHATPSSSLAAELHSAIQPFVMPRPFAVLPPELQLGVFDPFHLRARSPLADVVLLLALLSKTAAEPVSFGPDATAPATAGAPSASSGSSKRVTAVLQRDTALFLLSDVFSLAGSAFAAAPVVVAAVSRFVCPAVLSHALTSRILAAPLSIASAPPERDVAAGLSGVHPRPEAYGAATGVSIPPMSLYHCLLQVVGALWTARGSDETAGEGAAYSSLEPSLLPGVSVPVNIREACARELTALFRGVILPVLSSRLTPPRLKIETVEAMSSWLSAPQNLMELYINHDMYPAAACPYAHMRLLRSMVATLVHTITARYVRSASGGPTAATSATGAVDGTDIMCFNLADPDAVPHPETLPPSASPQERAAAWDAWYREDYRRAATSLVSSIVRCLMDSAATVHLQTSKDEVDVRPAMAAAAPSPAQRRSSTGTSGTLTVVPPTPDVSAGQKISPRGGAFGIADGNAAVSVRAMHTKQQELESAYESALAIFKEKGVRKGLVPLFEKGYLGKSGGSIAHFLRLCGPELTLPAEIGDYLGDEGRGDAEKELMTSVRREYFGGMSFAGMSFDVALRVLLTKAGFRLPGEAQKINRVAHAFAVAFYEDNKPTQSMLEAAGHVDPGTTDNENAGVGGKPADKAAKPALSIATADGRFFPTSADVVEILTFSCIMLNTDAHNPSIKKEKKMTRKQFINNNRGIDHDRDVSPAFLEHIYEAITTNEIKMEVPTAASLAAAAAGPTASAVPGSTPGTPTAGAPGALPPLPGALHFETEGESLAGPEGLPSFMKQLSESAFRWIHHLSAQAKADDRRSSTRPLTPGTPADRVGEIATEYRPVPYRRNFSTTTVACALEDLWPAIMRLMTVVLRIQPRRERKAEAGTPSAPGKGAPAAHQSAATARRVSMGFSFFGTAASAAVHAATPTPDDLEDSIPIANLRAASPEETEIRLATLDTLKYAVSACIFVGFSKRIRQGADALLQVEAAALGREVARKSMLDGWYAAVVQFADDAASGSPPDAASIAGVIGEMHIAVAEMREALTNIADKAVVESTAGKFTGELSKLLADDPRRKLVYEGELTKVASKGLGRHTVYRFFLFNDNLVYASKPLFSTRYNVHQIIPLKGMRLTENPEELRSQGIASSIKLENDKKNLYLYGPEQDMIEWRRHIREAIAQINAGYEPGASGASSAAYLSRRGSVMPTTRRDSDVGPRTLVSRLASITESRGTDAPSGRHSIATAPRVASLNDLGSAEKPAAVAAPPPPPPVRALSGTETAEPASARQTPVKTEALESREAAAASTPASVTSAPGGAAARPPAPADAAPAEKVDPRSLAQVAPPPPGPAAVPQLQPGANGAAARPEHDSSTVAASADASPPVSARHSMQTIAELKTAFLHAVAFCRPLLSSDGGALPSGQRMEGGLASPSVTLALTDADKLAFYAYFKQATHGDCPAITSDDDITMMTASTVDDSHRSDTPRHTELSPAALVVTKAKRDAWRRCAGMRRRDAMKAFVTLLDRAVPAWDSSSATLPADTKKPEPT